MSKIKFREKWWLPLIIGLIVATSIYFVANAFFFVQRSHARIDSLMKYLRVQGYTTIEEYPCEFPEEEYTVDDCNGDDGLFLSNVLTYNPDVIHYGKYNLGGFMWFFVDDDHIVINYHKLW